MRAETPFRWLRDVFLVPMVVALSVFSCLMRTLTRVPLRFGVAGACCEGAVGGGVRSCGRGSELGGEGPGGTVIDCLPLLGGGYTSPLAAASCALCCASAFVGLPRFFLFAGSPDGFMVDV